MQNTFITLEDVDGNIISRSIEGLINKKIAIHCDTEEKANEFLKKLDTVDVIWGNGSRAIDGNEHNAYAEDTCYDMENGKDWLSYGSQQFYLSDRMMMIYKYKLDSEVTEFKVGDKVKVENVNHMEISLNSDMKEMLDEVFTIKSITDKGNYTVEENRWIWGRSNLQLIDNKTSSHTLKVWELEEGKEYTTSAHGSSVIFKMNRFGELLSATEIEREWRDETDCSYLGEILNYEFTPKKTELEAKLDGLLCEYSKEDILKVLANAK